MQDDLDVTQPSSKKAKLDIPALDLFSPPVERKRSESVTSTPSALLPAPLPNPNTPLDPATCMWADACLATAHRPTPAVGRTLNLTHPSSSTSARPQSASQSSSKARAELRHVGSHVTGSGPSSSSKTWLDSPSVLGRSRQVAPPAAGGVPKANPVTLGFMSPPMRVTSSSRRKVSSLGLTSPLGRVSGNSNSSSVASMSVPASAAIEVMTTSHAAPFSVPDAPAQPHSHVQTAQHWPQFQKQMYPQSHHNEVTAAAGSHQGRAISQLPSFAAAFGGMFSPPCRPVTFGSAAKQGILMQPLGQGISMQPSERVMPAQPSRQGSFAPTLGQGLSGQLHSTMQPYAQTPTMPNLGMSHMGVSAAVSAPQRFFANALGSYFPQNAFSPASHVSEQAPRVSTLDMLLGTDKLRSLVRADVQLPAGVVQIPSTSSALQAANPSFLDSVTAFADGFALPGSLREQSLGGAFACCTHDSSAVASTCAMDAVEIFESDAAAVKLHELSEDGTLSCFDSDQMVCDMDQ